MNCLTESMKRNIWTKNCTDPPPLPENFYDRLVPHSTDTSSALKGRPKRGSRLVILQFSPCTVLFGILPSSLLPKIDHRSPILKIFAEALIFYIFHRGQIFENFSSSPNHTILILSVNIQSTSLPECSLRESFNYFSHYWNL